MKAYDMSDAMERARKLVSGEHRPPKKALVQMWPQTWRGEILSRANRRFAHHAVFDPVLREVLSMRHHPWSAEKRRLAARIVFLEVYLSPYGVEHGLEPYWEIHTQQVNDLFANKEVN